MATSPITANAFVAYPFEPRLVSDTIAGAVGLSEQKSLKLTPWQKLNVQGLKLDDLIRDKLLETDALIADISTPNFNVYYEIAYALAIEKPVVPIVNVSLDRAKSNVELTGLFDNIGWIEYNNSDELSDNLDEWRAGKWVERYDPGKDHAQPLFILDTFAKSEFRQYIFQAVSARHVNFRSFDPYEIPRLTASKAISLVSSSAGCIIPLLSSDITDHYKHNLRAAFLAGLCHGYGIEPLIIQYYNGPSPADFRDFITTTASRTETHRHVEEYCGQVLIRNQVLALSGRRYQLGLLNSIDLGASAAENEGASLDKYFIATAQHERASRTDHALVVGRKGSGKTAIFYQVRNSLLRKKETIVIELRPATHNLSEMREQLLSIVNGGAFDHTISAFRTYILLVEVLLSLREAALPLATRNFEMQDRIRNLEDLLELDDTKVSGDFTSRLEQAIADTIEAFRSDTPKRGVGARAMTNVIYETVIPKLRDMVVDFGDIRYSRSY